MPDFREVPIYSESDDRAGDGYGEVSASCVFVARHPKEAAGGRFCRSAAIGSRKSQERHRGAMVHI